ncbi:MAG TPA: hypothetical protein VF765_27080 [Polyangiaceae bacterium]
MAAALFAATWCLAGLAGCSSASNGLGGGGKQTCASSACPGGQSYQACTTTDPATGACTGISYSVGGQTFNCASCGDCSEAAQQVAAACEGGGGDGGTGSSSGGGSGSSSGSSGGGACSAPQACGTGGRTYEECTNLSTSGQCEAIVYKTSDGHSFTCPGCTSCSAAAQQLASYCASTGGDGGTGHETCSSSVPCGSSGMTYDECTTTGSNGECQSIQYKLSNGNLYTCASCSDCTAAVQSLDTFCQDQGMATTSCTSWATCATSSISYETCTTSLNGVCQSIYYETSDGMTYDCNSCSDCSTASTNMENHCASQESMTSCGSATTCGSTGVTYEQCETTTGGSCTSIYYSTTDGQTFTCNSCSDCSSASSSLSSYCASLTGTTCGSSTCSAGYLCCNCSGTQECLSDGGGIYTCSSYNCQ